MANTKRTRLISTGKEGRVRCADVMQSLRALGTAQNVKVYRRHGCGENVFGVSYASLKLLRREIGTDHQLAGQLWDTGNSDARSLAMMVADPAQITATQADAWCRSVTYHIHASELADIVARSPVARGRMTRWCRQKSEMVRAAGYALLSAILKHAPEQLSDSDCAGAIDTIAGQIHSSANRARHAMAVALIAIASTRPELAAAALAAGEKIGPVEVDHGETSCQTPQIVPTIQGMLSGKKRTRIPHTC